MGDIIIDNTKKIAGAMLNDIEKSIQEKNKREEKNRLNRKIEKMSLEDASDELIRSKEMYRQIKYGLDNKSEEIKKMEKLSEVKNYLIVLSQKEGLEEDIDKVREKIIILEQKLCTHDILYLLSYPKKSLAYCPNFKCLCCGKNINGFIDEDQYCINERFLKENEYYYGGDIYEFMTLQYKYNELFDIGETEEEILIELQDELYKSHKDDSKTVKLLRNKKRD